MADRLVRVEQRLPAGVKPSTFSPRVRPTVLGSLTPVALFCPTRDSYTATANDPLKFKNLVTNFSGDVTSNGSSFRYWSQSKSGQVWRSSYSAGDANNIFLTLNGDTHLNEKRFSTWASYTIFLLFDHASANSIQYIHFESTRFCQFYLDSLSNTLVTGRAINNTNWTAGADFSISADIAYGKQHLLAMVWDGGAGTRRIYIDDSFQEHTGFSGTLSSSLVSSSISAMTCSRDAGIYAFGIFHGAATPAQLKTLRLDTYNELFEPEAIWLPSQSAVSGAPTLSDLQAVSITASSVQGTYDYAF